MAGILVYSDKNNLAQELLTAAELIAANTGISIKAVSINNEEQAQELAARGAECYKIANAELSHVDTAAIASALDQVAKKLEADIVLLSSNRRGKELAGRLAQKLGAGCLTDVNGLHVAGGSIECVRNALGGATVATQTITSRPKVIAIAPKAFAAAGEKAGGSVNELDVKAEGSGIRLVETRSKAGDTVDIETANVLVAVGQGLENKEDLLLVEDIAKALGGEVACSKPVATDKKWLSEERVIGLSGKLCKPQLAILLGISGQVQFVVGIREAKTIVAINNDENAYILQMADYVMVADIKDVLPKLKRTLAG